MWSIFSILILLVLLVLLILAFMFRGKTPTDKFYVAYYEDGLWDIYVGTICLMLALAEWFDMSLIAIAPALLYPILLGAKQAITAPRLHPDDLPPTQDKPQGMMALLMLGLALFSGLLIFALMGGAQIPWIRAWIDQYLLATVWLLVIALCAIWGYTSKTARLYGYAALFLIAFFVSFWFDLSLYVYALVIGAVICMSGITVMMSFLREHPKLAHG